MSWMKGTEPVVAARCLYDVGRENVSNVLRPDGPRTRDAQRNLVGLVASVDVGALGDE